MLLADNVNSKLKMIKRDKEGHYILIRGKIQKEVLLIINIYAPNTGVPNYIRQILMDMEN